MKRLIVSFLVLAVSVATWPTASAEDAKVEEAKGELIFELKAFKSEVTPKKKILKQLEAGFLEWAVLENNELVTTLVNRKFIKPNLNEMTRFAEETSVKLDPGTYSVTCIGFWHRSNSGDIDKVLSESAFFNISVASFTINPSKTTRIEVYPTIKKRGAGGFWKPRTTIFSPDLDVKIYEGEELTFEGDISSETEKSISWDDYSGPLKR